MCQDFANFHPLEAFVTESTPNMVRTVAIPKSVLVVVVLVLFLVPGCAAPAPTYSCTPEVGGEPYTCVKEQYDLMQERNKLYAEAEAVYRKFLAEDERIYRAGGVNEATPVMRETLTGQALESALSDYRTLVSGRSTAVGGQFRVGYLHRVPDAVQGDSVVTWESCIDTTTVTFKDSAHSSTGEFGLERAYFSKTDTGLKISQFMRRNAESCG
jgi:hypothetical protein